MENSEISGTLITEFPISVAHTDNRFYGLYQYSTWLQTRQTGIKTQLKTTKNRNTLPNCQ